MYFEFGMTMTVFDVNTLFQISQKFEYLSMIHSSMWIEEPGTQDEHSHSAFC
jgi:hypothetical protein